MSDLNLRVQAGVYVLTTRDFYESRESQLLASNS